MMDGGCSAQFNGGNVTHDPCLILALKERSDPLMYVGSKERLLDLENTWLIYRGLVMLLMHFESLIGPCTICARHFPRGRVQQQRHDHTLSTRSSVSAHSLLDDLDPLAPRGRDADEL